MKLLPLASAVLFLSGGLALAQPPQPTTSTVPGKCTWAWKTGAGLGVWAERCTLDTGVWEVNFDAARQGFVLTVDGGDALVVLQPFAKAADADVSAILPDLRKGGFIPDDDECVFQPASDRPSTATVAFFEIRPTGARLKAFEADAGRRGAGCAVPGIWLVGGGRALLHDRRGAPDGG